MATCDSPDSKGQQEKGQNAKGGGVLGFMAKSFNFAKAVLTVSVALVHKTMQSITKDGHIAAAGRQGADEIGQALKAFPDSIQAQEPGTVLNPTQGEIQANRNENIYGRSSLSGLRSPSEIAAEHGGVHGPQRGNGVAQGNVHGVPPLLSPSEIAAAHGGQILTEEKPKETPWGERADGKPWTQAIGKGGTPQSTPQQDTPPDRTAEGNTAEQGGTQGQGQQTQPQPASDNTQVQPSTAKGFVDRVEDRRQEASGGSTEDANQRAIQRSLAEEELERQKQRENDLGLGF